MKKKKSIKKQTKKHKKSGLRKGQSPLQTSESKNLEKTIEEKVIKIAIEVCKKGEGALFVIGDNIKYDRLLKQEIKPFNITDRGAQKVLLGLAIIDGAVIIDKQGNVIDYATMIKGTKAFKGYGTRHSAGITASKKENIAILCSEEERNVKIFKNGKYIMQIDALKKGIEKDTKEIAGMLETIGAGFIAMLGAATLVPSLGITLLPGVVIFGGSYYGIKTLFKKFKIK